MASEAPPAAKKSRIEPTPVLPECFVRPVQQTTVYVATVTDKKFTSSIVRTLSDRFPLKELQHLKRVRNCGTSLEVILCRDKSDIQAISQAVQQGLDIDGVREQQVALYAPLTREQFEQSLKLWPTQFHEDKLTRSILDGSIFSATDREQIDRCMRVVIDRAHEEKTTIAPSASTEGCDLNEKRSTPNVAVIVNPRNGMILAVGVDRRHVHPALHATMAAIDLVATLQGGGAWGTGALLGGREVDRNDQIVENYDSSVEDADKDIKTPYICTGYDAYLLQEPCTMCSMALVHSRIRRAFYGYPNERDGALGSRFSVHCLGGLNHSFYVWKNVLREECTLLT